MTALPMSPSSVVRSLCRCAAVLILPWVASPLHAVDGAEEYHRGALQLFPGPLGPLVSAESTDPQAGAPGTPAGWHLPGEGFKGGEGWWALVCSDGCRLSPTVLSVQPARHPVYDGEAIPSQLLHWSPLPVRLDEVPAAPEVEQGGGPVLIAVFRPVAALPRLKLAAGPVKTWVHRGMASYPAGGRPGTFEVSLPVEGSEPVRVVPRLTPGKVTEENAVAEPVMSFELRVGSRRQQLGSFSFDIEGMGPLPPAEYLHWAGDLDGDGRPDLLMNMSRGGRQVVLWLSSLARPGELVGEAGRFDFYDPSAAGC